MFMKYLSRIGVIVFLLARLVYVLVFYNFWRLKALCRQTISLHQMNNMASVEYSKLETVFCVG